jgi:hypothetical protein
MALQQYRSWVTMYLLTKKTDESLPYPALTGDKPRFTIMSEVQPSAMNAVRTMLGISLIAVFMATPPAFALQAAQDEGTVVGHLTHVDGTLLRYVTDDEDWVHVVKDSPVGMDDLLFCEEDSKAEIIIPNNTWIRTGGNTKLHIIQLKNDTTELDMDSGLARFYNKSTSATIKVATPFGSVLASPLTVFDAHLKADSVQIQSLEGTATFSFLHDNSSHEVKAGGASLLADYENITAGADATDEAWNAWNREMDNTWEGRLQDEGEAHQYLPDTIRHESYALHENGIWETVYYEGRNCSLWRPLYVPSYWSPYTVGRWTSWYGDQCWIPYEPFGYVTHHYGNWVYIDRCRRWYWAPPDCHRRNKDVYFLVIPFAWYPGRVSWIHRDDYVGWIPLAPFEPYYCYRNWGPLSRVVAKDPRRHHKDFDVKACRYKKHAVIVNKSDLYRSSNYSQQRINNRADAFIDNFRREASINSRVIINFKTIKQRFAFDTRAAKKLRQPAAGRPAARIKSDDHLLVQKKPAIQQTAAQPERSTIPTQPARTVPARTKHFPEGHIIREHTVSTFKPIQRYKPNINVPEAETRLPVAPERKGRIGIPRGEQRQELPNTNRQRPAPGSGFSFQSREAPRRPHLQNPYSTPRLQVDRPAAYSERGIINRSYIAPRSSDFGRR